jgi:hypothetical protein
MRLKTIPYILNLKLTKNSLFNKYFYINNIIILSYDISYFNKELTLTYIIAMYINEPNQRIHSH